MSTSWVAKVLWIVATLGACSETVIEASSAGTTGSTGSGGSSGGSGGSGGTTTSATTGGAAPTTIPCGEGDCALTQLCVVPACKHVLGEECYVAAPDAGAVCPPGEVRGPQFDADCPGPGAYACVDGCPPAPPFCVDLPGGCGGVATCGCLASDPCLPSNSGACHDADIVGGVLSCSLMP